MEAEGSIGRSYLADDSPAKTTVRCPLEFGDPVFLVGANGPP